MEISFDSRKRQRKWKPEVYKSPYGMYCFQWFFGNIGIKFTLKNNYER